MKPRLKLARILYRLMVLVAPDPEPAKLPDALQAHEPPADAAIEADPTPEQWTPKQKGNVILVEPDLMRQHRRGDI